MCRRCKESIFVNRHEPSTGNSGANTLAKSLRACGVHFAQKISNEWRWLEMEISR